jgi:hypothetical protein
MHSPFLKLAHRFRSLFMVAWAACLADGGEARAQFTNLDFETTSFMGMVSPIFGFQGWSLSGGSVNYDVLAVGSANISLLDRDAMYFGDLVLQGNASIALQAGVLVSPSGAEPLVPVSIAETGQIPAGTQSLRFLANDPQSALFVTFNGQNLPLFQQDQYDYAADLSALAGRTGELRFGATPVTATYAGVNGTPITILRDATVVLDAISFSIQPVPEPGTGALLLCGAALVAWSVPRTRAKKKRL